MRLQYIITPSQWHLILEKKTMKESTIVDDGRRSRRIDAAPTSFRRRWTNGQMDGQKCFSLQEKLGDCFTFHGASSVH